MDKLKSWLIPGLIVIIVIGGLVIWRGYTPDAQTPDVVIGTDKPDGPKGFAEPVEPPPKEKAKINSNAMSDALRSGNIEDCSKIVFDEDLMGQCQDNLSYANILKSGDLSLCDSLHDEILRTQCHNKIYTSTAIDKRDSTLCEMIVDPAVAQLCKDQVQTILSRYAQSIDECDTINSAELKQQCQDTFELQSSAETLNLENCDNISDEKLADQCRATVTQNIKVVEQSQQAAQSAQVAKTPQEVLVVCDSLTGARETACKDAVYPDLAIEEMDLSYCDKISENSVSAQCRKETQISINQYYMRQSIAQKDKLLCEKITDESLKAVCKAS